MFGGTRQGDRSVSTYDQRHVISATAAYDLPFGRGKRFLSHTWKPLDYVIGGWNLNGLQRSRSGFPYIPYLADANQMGDLTHSARPDLVPGVPIVNPLWKRTCPVGTGCEPYVNPAAFMRPALGQMGSAPRTLDGARGPWQHYLDVNIKKTFWFGESAKRGLQLRMDALNVFNRPVFQVYPSNAGGADFMNAPSTANLTTAAYNTWAAYNSQPLYSTTAGATIYNQVIAMVNAQKNAAGVLPANFFTVPLPQGFATKNANSFDITTVNGYKLYQLRNYYVTNFGTLYQSGSPRYIQFSLKFFF